MMFSFCQLKFNNTVAHFLQDSPWKNFKGLPVHTNSDLSFVNSKTGLKLVSFSFKVVEPSINWLQHFDWAPSHIFTSQTWLFYETSKIANFHWLCSVPTRSFWLTGVDMGHDTCHSDCWVASQLPPSPCIRITCTKVIHQTPTILRLQHQSYGISIINAVLLLASEYCVKNKP